MKFLCEQCKAKYQISDDKVAGKTVRMKCRKCGHMIEVRADVTETSVSKGLPADPTLRPSGTPAPPAGAGASAGSAAPKRPSAPGQPPRAPQKPVPPRASPLATPLGQAKPLGARTPLAPAAARQNSSIPPGSQAPNSALAGAFQKSVKDDALGMMEVSGSSEWYVAINGVPVGPVRVTELRRKASLGAVTDDSLVWQEGMEEWRPVRTVTELASLVREAAAGTRPSLASGPDGSARSSTPPPASGRASQPPPRASGIPPRPAMGSRPPGAVAARSNVVPITSRLATAEKLEEEADLTEVSSGPPVAAPRTPPPAAPTRSPTPFGAVATTARAAPTPYGATSAPTDAGVNAARASGLQAFDMPMPSRPGLVAPDPFAPPPPAATTSTPDANGAAAFGAGAFGGGAALASAGSTPFGAPATVAEAPKKAPPWMAIAMIVLAAAFGVTAALVVFFRSPAAPAPVVIQVPSAATTPTASATAPASNETIELPAPTTTSTESKPTAHAGGSRPSHGSSGTSSGGGAADLSDLLKGTGGGPNVGGGGGGGGGGGSSLTESQITNVVQNQSVGIRRTCWERSTSQQSSVNVTVRMTVNGSGQVTSSNADGNDPAVAKCIENGVRSWRFPPTGGTSQIAIPFKFVRQ